jgi:hypothetical protein
VLLDHLRSDAGQYTHRVAQVLKIGNHELELLIDKNASGVAVVEPYVPFQRTVSPAATATGGASFKWLWWAIAAAVALYFLAGPQTSKPSYQPSTYTPPYQPRTRPAYQPSTPPPSIRTEPLQPTARPPAPAPTPALPQSGASADSLADHGPGRVTCDVQWSQLHRRESGYQDFIRDCMRRVR